MSKPLNLPEPDICDMNCFYKPGHAGRHQFETEADALKRLRQHPDYGFCTCDTAEEHVAVVLDETKSCKECLTVGEVNCNVHKGKRQFQFEAEMKLTEFGEGYFTRLLEESKLKIYQCGPMAGCTDEEMYGWRNELKKDYPQLTWLDPCDRTYQMQQWRSLVNDDIADIDNADYVLAYYWKTGTGSAMELSYNYYVAKKPSIVVVPGFKAVSPWLRYHADYLVDTFDHAMKIILNNDDTKF